MQGIRSRRILIFLLNIVICRSTVGMRGQGEVSLGVMIKLPSGRITLWRPISPAATECLLTLLALWEVYLWRQGWVIHRSCMFSCCQKYELPRVPLQVQSSTSPLHMGVLVFEHPPQCSPRTAWAGFFSSSVHPPGFLCKCGNLCRGWWSNRKHFWLFSGVWPRKTKQAPESHILGHFPLDGANGGHFCWCQKCIKLMLTEQALGVRKK